jgi:hypothetical protein
MLERRGLDRADRARPWHWWMPPRGACVLLLLLRRDQRA